MTYLRDEVPVLFDTDRSGLDENPVLEMTNGDKCDKKYLVQNHFV